MEKQINCFQEAIKDQIQEMSRVNSLDMAMNCDGRETKTTAHIAAGTDRAVIKSTTAHIRRISLNVTNAETTIATKISENFADESITSWQSVVVPFEYASLMSPMIPSGPLLL